MSVSIKWIGYNKLDRKDKDMIAVLNENSKERLLQKENIDRFSKALTHYVFRNGPVEDIHANSHLTDADMKILNKYMVDKIATILSLAMDGEWLKIELLMSFYSLYGVDWDPAEVDTSEVDMIFKNALGFGTPEKEREEAVEVS